ncbi:hypothetical protein ACQ4M4_19925 [Leptolyngbya sp. AN02str]|uniref:hypothetical protein n=1 Tax=Leptolyngbya sp. AN02str TaxID=3423363 RepID=UPI003D321E9D
MVTKTNGAKTESSSQSTSVDVADDDTVETAKAAGSTAVSTDDLDDILGSLKSLLSTVEKLQKARQDVGDIKPLLVRMLDGELVAGDDLEQLKTGIAGLMRLVRAHSDHQTALSKAQPARDLLDQVMK